MVDRRAVLLGLALLAAGAAALPPTVTWQNFDTTGSSFSYKWTLEKTVNGQPFGTVPNVRIQKGVTDTVQYSLKYTRAIDTASLNMVVSGGLTITNANTDAAATLTITAVSLSVVDTGGTGAPTAVNPDCPGLNSPLPPAGFVTCTFRNARFTGYPNAGEVTATVQFVDASPTPATSPFQSTSPRFSYETVQGKYATALLTDKVDASALNTLYNGFTGFVYTSVWRPVDASTSIPDAGIQVMDTGSRDYAVKVGSFAVCTGTSAITISNTATLTPQPDGAAIPSTARVSLAVWGCELPPDVNFQDVQTWGAQTFTWQLAKTATRNAFTVQQDAGAVPMEYTIKATAQPSTASYAVSGAVFINNVQPGIMNVARVQVTLSSGQTATPQCALTTPWVSPDGLVWGGANSGGSVTTMPFINGGVATVGGVGVGGVGVGVVGTGTWVQFVLPEFASATCRFNISLGNQLPGGVVQITPQVNWGFGGMYMLNQPSQLQVNFNPPSQFFPVSNCISLTDVSQAGALMVANGGPNNQQVCVDGQTQPFNQPAPIVYTVVATVNPTTTADCQPGSSKTYTVANTVTGTPVGGVAGSPVTATATPPVTITVNCPKKDTVTVVQTLEDKPQLNIGGFQTYVTGAHDWTVSKTADPQTLSLGIGQLPKTVTYTVTLTKQPATNDKFFVAGKITVTNPGKSAVELSSVSVTAGTAAVPATCAGGVTDIAPNVPVVCTFNVSWNNGANAGSLGARVDTPFASFTAPAASFDFTNPKRGASAGETAGLFDDVEAKAPAGATGVPTKWWTPDANAPPTTADGVPLTAADSKTYTYTVQVGPFADKGSCGTYTLTNKATVAPDGAGASAPVSDSATVSLTVNGCKDTELQSVKGAGIAIVVSQVATANLTGSAWAVDGTAVPPSLDLDVAKSSTVTFNVGIVKVPTVTHEVSGTLTLTNTQPSGSVTITDINVAIEPANGPAKTVDATCGAQGKTLTLAAGNSVPCTFTAPMGPETYGKGTITGTVTTGDGSSTDSDPFSFDYTAATVKAADSAPACATATTGMVVGVSRWQPDGRVGFTTSDKRVCDSDSIAVTATVGPFKDNQCGSYDLTTVATVQPLAVGAAPVTRSIPLPLKVTGCPPGAAQVAVTGGPVDVSVDEVYSWTAKLSSDAANPVTLTPKAPTKVTFVAETQRSAVQRGATVKGSVTLEAGTADTVTVQAATVAVYDAKGAYTSAPLDCGASGKPGGPVTLRGKGAPVTCTYKATGLAVGAGVVVPVVIPAAAPGPVPATTAVYSTAKAPKNIVGDCADLGSSLVLTQAGKRAAWQPAFVGMPLSSGSDCEGGDTHRFSLWFGADAKGTPLSPPPACGDYDFQGDLTLLPTNGDAIVSDVKFPVKVTGCRRRRQRLLLGA